MTIEMGGFFATIAAIMVGITAVAVALSQFFYGRPVVSNLRDRMSQLEKELQLAHDREINETAHNVERAERIKALEARPDMSTLAAAIANLAELVRKLNEQFTQGLTLSDIHEAVKISEERARMRDMQLVETMQAIRDDTRRWHGGAT